MKVHNLVSVAQLEPSSSLPAETDPYHRSHPDQNNPPAVEDGDSDNPSYEDEHLLRRRATLTGRLKYLVK